MRRDDVGKGGVPDARPRAVVVIWDEDRDRRLALEAFTADADADVVVCGPGSAAPTLGVTSPPSLRFGLVSLGTERTRDAALSVIRDLTRSGARVIAYGDRLHEWTIGLRCQA